MMSSKDRVESLRLAEEFFRLLEGGDLIGFASLFHDDATVWHNTDNRHQSLDECIAGIRALRDSLLQLKFRLFAIHVIDSGFIAEYAVTGNQKNGDAFSMPVCTRVVVIGSKIGEIREYLDSAYFAALSP